MIVSKAVRMANMMNIPVLGLVENMAYFICDECGKAHNIFGESHTQEAADAAGVPLLAQLPIDPSKAALADAGKIGEAQVEDILSGALDAVNEMLKPVK